MAEHRILSCVSLSTAAAAVVSAVAAIARRPVRATARARPLSSVGGIALLGLVAGCTLVGPDYHRPDVPKPAGWSSPAASSAATAPLSRPVTRSFDGHAWWSVFHDAELDRLVGEAVAQNLDLQTAALRIAEARAQRASAAGALFPTVSGNVVAVRDRMSQNGIASALGGSSSNGNGSSNGSANGGSGGSSSGGSMSSLVSNFFQIGFDTTWELDLWGKTRRSIEAADATIEAAEASRRDAAISLTAEVAQNYLNLRGSQRQLDITRTDIDTQSKQLALQQSLSDAGLAPLSSVVEQRAQLAGSTAQLPSLTQQIEAATNRIALLLAAPPGALHERLKTAPKKPPPLPPEVPIGLPGDLLQRRADVRRSEAQLRSATAQIGVAKASLFPSIQLGISGGLQATRASDLFDWASRFVAGGTAITVPIFQGGQLRAQLRLADEQAREAAIAYRQAVLSAYHDADNALLAYADEQRRLDSLQRQLGEARRSQALADSRFRSGLAPRSDVLSAERTTHQAEQALDQSATTASTNLVALYKSLGGGWDDADSASVPTPESAAAH